MAGDLPFSIQWRGPADPRDAGAQVIEHIVPVFREAGYEIAERKPDRLVLRRRMSDFAELPGCLTDDATGTLQSVVHSSMSSS